MIPNLNRFEKLARCLENRPFLPHRLLTQPHLQTIFASRQRRNFDWGYKYFKETDLRLSHDVRIRIRMSEAGSDKPTLIALHGMSGSFDSQYMLAFAHKAFLEGWNSILLNLHNENRNRHTPKIFHAGCSDELVDAFNQLRIDFGVQTVFAVGISMGGNILLKALGEWGDQVPDFLSAAAVISPLLDLSHSAPIFEKTSNRLYRYYYVYRLKRQALSLSNNLGKFVDLELLKRARSIQDFDRVVTVPLGGFSSLDDYYHQASALPSLSAIRLPTFLIHSRDDPLLPMLPFLAEPNSTHDWIFKKLTTHGGHAAFLENDRIDIDRSWAENRVMDYFDLMND